MWEDNIKLDLEVKDKEEWAVALADTMTNIRILYNVRTLTRRETIAF